MHQAEAKHPTSSMESKVEHNLYTPQYEEIEFPDRKQVGKKQKKKISFGGVMKIALQALAGAAVVVVGTKLCELVENNTERYELQPQPENFDLDKAAYKIWKQLRAWKKYSPLDYEHSVRATDLLLQIERALSTLGSEYIEVEEIKRAEQAFIMAVSYLDSLKEHVEKSGKIHPRSVLKLEYVLQNANQFLSLHLQAIYILTCFL